MFQGAVDEVRLWNSVRSAQQIADNKDQALVGDEAGLLMYLKADETSGGTLADASGRGNAGQMVHPWSSVPGVVAGRIDFGQQDYYRFTLADTTRLYFDSLTDHNNLRWYLSGPRGTVVSDRPFQSSDSQNGLSVFDLVAGDYTLRIDGVGDATGDYGFRLLDLAGALELDFDTVVNGQHTPATATTAYRFTAEAGERLYFDEVSASGGYPYWRLLDPWGRNLWGPNYLPSDDVRLQTLPFAGVYTLLVEGRRDGGSGSSNFSFRVQRVRDLTQAITLDGVYGMPAPWANGHFGGALHFNGVQSAQIDHAAALDLTDTLTLETWVKVDRFDNTWTTLFYKGNPENPGERSYSLWLHSNGSVAFDTGDGSNQSTQTGSGLITTGQWHHIAAVMDRTAGTVRILVDGVLQKSGTNIRKNPASSNSKPLYLGSALEPGSSYASLVGSMDDIRVWNVARSDAEILASMNAPLVGNAAGLVAYIKADEGVGNSAADATGHGHVVRLSEATAPVIVGAIEHVGQLVNYTFTLSEASTRVYFDAMTDSSNVRWSLTGPRGTLVSGRHFQQSDSVDALSLFDLPAGDYQLSIAGYQDYTGEFRFRLLDLAAASILAPGTPVSGRLTPANQTDAYQFTANAGERYFFERISEVAGDIYWRLLDPWGRTVWGASNFNADAGLFTLAYDGIYTLLMEGRRSVAGNASYSFNVQPVADDVVNLTLGAAVSGSIEHAAQQDYYDFRLEAGSALYFDSLTNSTDFTWTLSGPRGPVVSARQFADSDSNDYKSNPVLSLEAGDYTLIVGGKDATTGAYGFRLVDLAAATLIDVGDTVTDTLNPGNATHLFRFAASARDRFNFELLSESANSPYWRLISPDYGVLFGPGATDDVVSTMPFTGTYYLLLEGRVSESKAVDYSFRIADTALPNSGGHSSQDFDADGLPWVAASFSNSAPVVIPGGPSGNFLRLLPGSVTGYNTIAFNNAGVGVIPATVSVDFDFRIGKVSNQGDGIGFAWLNADVWGISGPAPQFGEEVNLAGSFGVGFDPVNNGELSDNHVSLHFNGSKLAEFNLPGFRLDSGDFQHARVVIAAVTGGSKVSVYLTPNAGSEVAVVEDYFISGMQAYDGRMAFGARNGGWRADNDLDNIRVAVVAGTAETLPVLTLGTVAVSGTLSASGEIDRYRFSVTDATRTYFDSLTNNSSLRWSLSGPHGSVVADRSFTASDGYQGLSLLDLTAGDYLLSVFGSTGAYSFKLMDMDQGEVLTPDTPTSGTLSPGNETDIYRFDALAGEQFYFDRVSFSGGYYIDWRLIDPFGRPLWGPTHMYTNDVDLTTLPYSGTYYLLLEGRYHEDTASSYTINVRKIDNSVSTPIVVGDRVDAELSKPGEVDSFSFEIAGSESKRVYFDVLTNTSQLSWTLSGPRGSLVSGRLFSATDAANGRSIMDLAPGSYTLIVDGSGDATGAYAFRLLDLAAGTQIVPGTPLLERTLTPGNETDVYWFDAVAGERFYFDRVSFSGGYYTDWQLLDPAGNTLWGPTHMYYSDVDVTTLPRSGRYTLLVEGRYHEDAATSTYTINVQPVVDHVTPMTLDSEVAGSIDSVGQRGLHTFTLSETRQVYVDVLTNNGNFSWSLSGPRGSEVANHSFSSTDGVHGLSLLELLPGDYTLSIDGSGEATGAYALRLLDLAAAPLITPGTPVSSQLNPANSTDIFRFNAAAGDRFYFDRVSFSGAYYTEWRLLDPWGKTVWGPTHFYTNDVDVTTLEFDGLYTLLVEGRYHESGISNYTLNVSPSPLAQKIILTGLGSVPGADLKVENLVLTPVGGGLTAGGQVLVSWEVSNTGNLPADAPWKDRILVRNMDRGGELVVNLLVDYSDLGGAATDPLAVGARRARQVTVSLPPGNSGAGNLRFEVAADVTNVVAEPGVAELNNAASVNALAASTPYPDLQVDSVVVTPSSGWAAGSSVTVSWRVNNGGSVGVDDAWNDRLRVRNLSTGAILLNASSRYLPAVGGALAAGGSIDRRFTFNWPAGAVGSGQFEFLVSTDDDGEIFESNASDSAETNNAATVVVASAPDLLVQRLRVDAFTATAGDSVTVFWDDRNDGLIATPASWHDRLIVRNLSSGETLLDVALPYNIALIGNAALAPDASVARSYTFQLPEGLRGSGQIEVEVRADQNAAGQGSLVEYTAAGDGGESNNSARLAFTAAARPYADLAVGSLSAPSSGRGGETITLEWTVLNQGSIASGPQWSDLVVLSRDDVIGNADDVTLASVGHYGVLAPGASYQQSRQLLLPERLDGAFRVAVVADAFGELSEPDTRANNSALVTIDLSTPHADLQVEVVAAPASARSGEATPVSWRVRNAGDRPTDVTQWQDRIYLSSDAALDAGDTLLAQILHSGGLGAGESYSGQSNVFLPFGITGDYRILVRTDAASQVFESIFEDNNVTASHAAVQVLAPTLADLSVSEIVVPVPGAPGQTRIVAWTVANSGSGAARGSWSDRVYLSADGSLGSARLLATVPHSSELLALASYTASTEITLPDVADGDYFIVVSSDVGDTVFEGSQEGNNSSVSTATLGVVHPDLRPVLVSAPAGALSSEAIVVAWQMRNAGSSDAFGAWTDRLYLSRDATLGADDTLLGELAHGGPLATGASYDAQLQVNLPLAASGDYFLLLVGDALGQVHELGAENNNVGSTPFAAALAPYANLVVSAVSAEASVPYAPAPEVVVGDPAQITVSWTVGNDGNGVGQTTQWTDTLLVSTDSIVGNGDDRVLASYEHLGALAVGESYTRSETFLLPAYFQGRYHFFVRSDAGNQVFENGLEADNAAEAARIFDVVRIPYADLIVSQASVPATARSGQSMSVSWQVTNHGIGPTDIPGWNDVVTLADAAGKPVAVLGSFTHLGVLAAGDSYSRTQEVTIPNGLSGSYFVSVRTAGPEEFIYVDNNSRVAGLVDIVLSDSPDLQVSDIMTPETASEGDTIDVRWTVTNKGLAKADGAWTDVVSMRKVGQPNDPGIYLGTFTYDAGGLEAGISYTRTERFRLPARTEGVYQLVVLTNSSRQVYEYGGAAANNSAADDQVLQVALLPRSDLQVANVVAPARASAGATVSLRFSIINQGTVPTTTPRWQDRVYLSLDNKLSGDDLLIGSYDNGAALNPGEQYATDSGSLQIPIRFRGDVFLIVQADGSGSVDEYPNDANNIAAVPLFVEPYPLADLVAGSVVAPAQAVEGASIEVRYTVANRGSGTTAGANWTDTIWLSRDKTRPNASGNSAILLGALQHQGALAVGSSYDVVTQVALPAHVASGSYYITVWSDSYDVILEDTLASNLNPDDINELDNNNYKARAIDVIGGFAPPPPDLRISALAASPLASTSSALSVTWTVANSGAGEAAGSWNDVFWLSDKPTLNAAGAKQWYLGAVAHDGGAAPGASYTQSTSFALNPAASGQYLIAYTDYNPAKGKPYDVAEGDEENNTRVQDTGVVPSPADLQVLTIAAPGENFSGEKTTISWTVKNFGAAVWEGTRYWLDSVYLSPDPVFLPERATSLGTFVHNNAGGLAAGASYTESAEVTLPRGIGGNFYIYVITDANRYDPRYPAGEADVGVNAYYRDDYYPTSVYEGVGGQDNNRGVGSIPVTYREPDLKVTSLLVPPLGGQSGGTVTVNYTVTNIGNRDTREISWWDRLFLSKDVSLDTFDLQVAEARHYGVLNAGDSYTGTATVKLPDGIAGVFSLLAFTDSEADSRLAWWNSNIVPEYRGVGIDANNDAVPEFRGEGNNITVAPLPVTAAPLADLQVTAVSAPNHITVGNDFTVTYTVGNLGGADTLPEQERWDDLIYLSRDPLLDLDSDRYLLTVEHRGGLAQGDSYTVSRTLRAPLDISGAYYVFVVTDPARGSGRGKVFEGGFERNNATPNAPPSIFEVPPPADVQVDAITFAGTGAAGETLRVEWTVANHSSNVTSAAWTDAVYLSDDNLWDIGDRLLGKLAHSGVLAENDSYTASLEALVPPIKIGQYRVIVRPDIYNEVFEGPYRSAGEANNFSTSANALSIAVDELHLGVALSTTLSTGQSRVYKLTVGQGETLRLSLSAVDHDAANEIFVRYGDVPDGFNYDATYENPLQANQTAVIPFTRPGDYYVLIRGHSEPKENAQVKLLAEVVPFAITGVQVDQGGDSRWVTIDVRGAKFADNAILKLVRPGVAEYEPVKWEVIDSTWIRATFDFRDAPLGLYDLKVINPDGQQAVVAYRFLIERALETDVTIGLGGPRVLAAGETGTYGVALQSLSNVDTPYVRFSFGVPEMGATPTSTICLSSSITTTCVASPRAAARTCRGPASIRRPTATARSSHRATPMTSSPAVTSVPLSMSRPTRC
ncbi:MAG: CARDB domain-containing protein [Candidatus Accumulibacter delftensis]|jgi:subtilase family serine protease